MFAEFVVTYLPIAIAAVVLVPAVLVPIAMLFDTLRTKRWPSPAAPSVKASMPAARRESRRDVPRNTQIPVTTGGMGLRHGIAARRDHD